MVFLYLNRYRYLAELACDGREKRSLDEETTTCKDSSVHRIGSVNSQDTDVDVNLDSELISKDEADSSKSTLISLSAASSVALNQRS